MEGGGERKQRGSLEEDIYWPRFPYIYFDQALSNNDFHRQLAIPKLFLDKIKKKLPGNVTLRDPDGAIWNIGVTTKDDTVYFTQGWEQFVNDNSLKEGDFLGFAYDGDSLFEVVIGVVRCRTANVQQHDNVEQHGGRGKSKKRDIDNSAEDVTSDAGVEVARAEQFAPGGVNNTEPSYVPSKTTSKRVKRNANKKRGSVTDSSGPIDLGPISDPLGTSSDPKVRPNRNIKPPHEKTF